MSKTEQQILGFESMMRMVEAVKAGVPDDVLPPEFFSVTSENDGGRTATVTKLTGTRRPARNTGYGAKSRKINQADFATQKYTMIHTFEHIDHKLNVLAQLRDFENPTRQAKGEKAVDKQTMNFMTRLQSLRQTAVASILARAGVIDFDAEGHILPDTTGSQFQVDFEVPAGNQNQLDVFGGGDIIDASWGTSTTDIPGHVRQIIKASIQKTGFKVTGCIFGENIFSYLCGNDCVKNILQSNSGLANSFGQNDIPSGFLKLDWFDGSNFFFEDSAGDVQEMFGPDSITFIPDVTDDWYDLQEGSYVIPGSGGGGMSADAMAALADTEEVFGKFSYAKVIDDPVTVRHYHGDTMLPTLINPEAIFVADVTP